MSILTDSEIEFYLNMPQKEGGIVIDELIDPAEQIQPASVDLRLAGTFTGISNGMEALSNIDLMNTLRGVDDPKRPDTAIDPRKAPPENMYESITLKDGQYITIPPLTFILGATKERVALPSNIVGRVEGKSTFGRLGTSVHTTAGYIDPGFDGYITLEIFNHAPRPIKLYVGDAICQIVLEKTSAAAKRPYGCESRNNKYQGQEGTTVSRSHLGIKEEE